MAAIELQGVTDFNEVLRCLGGEAARAGVQSLSLRRCPCLTPNSLLRLPVLPNCTTVDLSDNNLEGLGDVSASASPLEDALWAAFAPRLEVLRLRWCNLTAVPALLSTPALRELDVSGNRIRAVEGLEGVQRTLETLDVSYNNISTAGALRVLGSLTALRELTLAPNPFTLANAPNKVRVLVAGWLPGLFTLDGAATPASVVKSVRLAKEKAAAAEGVVGKAEGKATKAGVLKSAGSSRSLGGPPSSGAAERPASPTGARLLASRTSSAFVLGKPASPVPAGMGGGVSAVSTPSLSGGEAAPVRLSALDAGSMSGLPSLSGLLAPVLIDPNGPTGPRRSIQRVPSMSAASAVTTASNHSSSSDAAASAPGSPARPAAPPSLAAAGDAPPSPSAARSSAAVAAPASTGATALPASRRAAASAMPVPARSKPAAAVGGPGPRMPSRAGIRSSPSASSRRATASGSGTGLELFTLPPQLSASPRAPPLDTPALPRPASLSLGATSAVGLAYDETAPVSDHETNHVTVHVDAVVAVPTVAAAIAAPPAPEPAAPPPVPVVEAEAEGEDAPRSASPPPAEGLAPPCLFTGRRKKSLTSTMQGGPPVSLPLPSPPTGPRASPPTTPGKPSSSTGVLRHQGRYLAATASSGFKARPTAAAARKALFEAEARRQAALMAHIRKTAAFSAAAKLRALIEDEERKVAAVDGEEVVHEAGVTTAFEGEEASPTLEAGGAPPATLPLPPVQLTEYQQYCASAQSSLQALAAIASSRASSRAASVAEPAALAAAAAASSAAAAVLASGAASPPAEERAGSVGSEDDEAPAAASHHAPCGLDASSTLVQAVSDLAHAFVGAATASESAVEGTVASVLQSLVAAGLLRAADAAAVKPTPSASVAALCIAAHLQALSEADGGAMHSAAGENASALDAGVLAALEQAVLATARLCLLARVSPPSASPSSAAVLPLSQVCALVHNALVGSPLAGPLLLPVVGGLLDSSSSIAPVTAAPAPSSASLPSVDAPAAPAPVVDSGYLSDDLPSLESDSCLETEVEDNTEEEQQEEEEEEEEEQKLPEAAAAPAEPDDDCGLGELAAATATTGSSAARTA